MRGSFFVETRFGTADSHSLAGRGTWRSGIGIVSFSIINNNIDGINDRLEMMGKSIGYGGGVILGEL